MTTASAAPTPSWRDLDRMMKRSLKSANIMVEACRVDRKLEKIGVSEKIRRLIAKAYLDYASRFIDINLLPPA
jgi:hypothetical protein